MSRTLQRLKLYIWFCVMCTERECSKRSNALRLAAAPSLAPPPYARRGRQLEYRPLHVRPGADLCVGSSGNKLTPASPQPLLCLSFMCGNSTIQWYFLFTMQCAAVTFTQIKNTAFTESSFSEKHTHKGCFCTPFVETFPRLQSLLFVIANAPIR